MTPECTIFTSINIQQDGPNTVMIHYFFQSDASTSLVEAAPIHVVLN
jgi:hypothetical protein